jgi:hypothetical protein
VTLKFRSLPLESFRARVRHIAPSADPGEVNSTLRVYCDPQNPGFSEEAGVLARARLRGGLSSYARISTGRRSIGAIVLDRLLSSLRTEYWW